MELPKLSMIAILFAFSILVHGEYLDSTLDSVKVFSTELVTEENVSYDFTSAHFSLEKISSSKPLVKIPFYQRFVFLPLFFQKKIKQVAFKSINSALLTFDKPTFFSPKRKSPYRSEIPNSNSFFL